MGVSWVTEENTKAQGVWGGPETVLADVGVLPLPSIQDQLWTLVGSRLVQASCFVMLIVSVLLVTLLGR